MGAERAAGKLLLTIGGSLALIVPTAANACIDITVPNLEDIRRADVVFVGDIVSYEMVESDPGSGFASEYGLLTINVLNTIRGSAPSTVKLAWTNSTFNLPPYIRIFRPAIYAASYDNGFPEPGRARSQTGELYLLSKPCSVRRFILPYSAADENVVRQVLSGGSATFEDLSASETDGDRLMAIRRNQTPTGLFYSAVIAAIGLLVVAFSYGMVRKVEAYG